MCNTHTHTHTHTHSHIHTHTHSLSLSHTHAHTQTRWEHACLFSVWHTHTHPHTHTHTHTHILTHTHTHTYIHTHILTHTHTHTRMHTHTYTHIHIHTCTHTHTYIHQREGLKISKSWVLHLCQYHMTQHKRHCPLNSSSNMTKHLKYRPLHNLYISGRVWRYRRVGLWSNGNDDVSFAWQCCGCVFVRVTWLFHTWHDSCMTYVRSHTCMFDMTHICCDMTHICCMCAMTHIWLDSSERWCLFCLAMPQVHFFWGLCMWNI